MIEDVGNVHFAHIVIQCRIIPSFVYCFPGFSGHILAILINDFKM